MVEATKLMNLSDNARTILELRYLDKDEQGKVTETSEDRLWHMCLWIASGELHPNLRPNNIDALIDIYTNWQQYTKDAHTSKYVDNFIKYSNRFWNELIFPLYFLPNSPTIVNAGKNRGSLSACYVRSPKDTMEDILQCIKDWGMIEKWGGGIGGGFSNIREKGSSISTTHGKALGPVAVMEILSKSSQKITQGSFREGAHMAQLFYNHPDILEFITCKDNCNSPTDTLHNFNISVQVDDWFMQQVEQGNWQIPIALISPKDNSISIKGHITVGQLWDAICQQAWKNGDPGLVFINRVRETEPNPQLGHIQSSNPCGEEFLEEYGSCNLGSIDLSKHVKRIDRIPQSDTPTSPTYFKELFDIDYNHLQKTIQMAIRFLDNVINVNEFPLSQIKAMNLRTRRIGLGVMGWHDLLSKLNISYDSEKAVQLASKLSHFITDEARLASLQLADEKGPFQEYNNSRLKDIGVPIRNSSVTTIAPTGTISLIASCSSGIEPYFDYVWERKAVWQEGVAQTTLFECPKFLKEELQSKIGESSLHSYLSRFKELANETKCHELDILKIDSNLYKPSYKISPEWHVKHLAAWQSGVTNSVSKTINLPDNYRNEDISNIFLQAWQMECKCITVYRDRSKEQVLNTTSNNNQFNSNGYKEELLINNPDISIKQSRPKTMRGTTHKVRTAHGNLYITVNILEDKPFEIFANMGKSGSCESAQMEAITRLVSLHLRSGGNINDIVDELRNITCCIRFDEGVRINSPSDAISYVLANYSDSYTQEIDKIKQEQDSIIIISICPDCAGKNVEYAEGCLKCLDCGWSKC